MFDADVVAILLNRLAGIEEKKDAHLELLREGNLRYAMVNGCIKTEDMETVGIWRTESLCFDDGSRALRIGSQTVDPIWSKWMALCPATVNTLQKGSRLERNKQ